MSEFDLVALIVPVLFPVLVGRAAVLARVLARTDARVLTSFFLYVAAPALLIVVIAKEDAAELFEPKYVAATTLLMLLQYGLLFSIHRYGSKRTAEVSAFAAFTGAKFNAVVMGLPVLLVALGHKVIGAVAMNLVISYLTILPLTLVIHQLGHSSQARVGTTVAGAVGHALRSALMYPLVVATLIGLGLSELGWRLPGWLDASLRGLGAAATPAALVAVGMAVSGGGFQTRRVEVSLMSLFRVVISPVMAIGLAFLMGLSPFFSIALVVSFSLPTAKMVFALAESYKTYSEEAANTIVVTTASMVVVFPAVLWTCEWLWPGVVGRH